MSKRMRCFIAGLYGVVMLPIMLIYLTVMYTLLAIGMIAMAICPKANKLATSVASFLAKVYNAISESMKNFAEENED